MSNYKDTPQQRQRGAILSYVYSLASIIVSLLYVPILIGGVGQSEYGLYQLIGSIIAYLSVMGSVLSGGITRFYCKYFIEDNIEMMENVLATGRSINRFVAIVLIPISFIAIIAVQCVYANSLTSTQLEESALMIIVLAINVFVTMSNIVNVAIINAHERFVFLKATQLLSVVLQPFLALLAITYLPYALTICVVQLLLNVFCAALQRIFARNVLKAKVRFHYRDKKLYKDLIVFSSGVLLVLVADQIFWKTNQLVLGYTHGMEVVAVYAIAMQICASYQPLGTAVSTVFMPKISELYFDKQDSKAISDLFCSIGRIAGYPLLLVLFGFSIFGEDFILLWAGSGFNQAFVIALIVMVPFTIDLLQNLGLYILQVANKYAFRGKMYLTMALLQLIFVLVIVPQYGPISAAIVTAVVFIIGNGVIMNWYYYHVLDLDVKKFWLGIVKEAFPLLIITILFIALINSFSVSFDSWFSLIVGILVFTGFYVIVAFLFSMNQEEKSLVKGLFKRSVHK